MLYILVLGFQWKTMVFLVLRQSHVLRLEQLAAVIPSVQDTLVA